MLPILFVMRRLMFAVAAVKFFKYPTFQIMILNFTNLSYVMFLGYY